MKMNVKIYLNTDESVVIGSFAVYMYMFSIKITILVRELCSLLFTNTYYRSNIL